MNGWAAAVFMFAGYLGFAVAVLLGVNDISRRLYRIEAQLWPKRKK